MMVHEVRANSILLLMTMLRDNRSTGDFPARGRPSHHVSTMIPSTSLLQIY